MEEIEDAYNYIVNELRKKRVSSSDDQYDEIMDGLFLDAIKKFKLGSAEVDCLDFILFEAEQEGTL
jgi:hypothetical protein